MTFEPPPPQPNPEAEPPGPQDPGSPVTAAETPRHLHPAALVIEGLRVARQAAIPAIIVAVGQGMVIALLALVALLLLAAVAGYLIWRSTTYTTGGGRLVRRSGLIARREQEVPAARISALDTSRGVLQRLFGVVELQVQTAGGGGRAELTLRAVSFEEAERIRRDLGHSLQPTTPAQPTVNEPPVPATQGPTFTVDGAPVAPAEVPRFLASEPEPDPAQIVFTMPARDLVIAALTSPSIAVVFAAGAGLASQASDLLPDGATDELGRTVEQLTVVAAVGLAIVAVITAALIAITGTVLMYAGFRVTRDEKRLRIRRGFLTERFSTIPLDRIHGVRIVESPLRQLLGFAALEVEVAGYAGREGYAGRDEDITRTLVPLVPRAQAAATLAAIVPALAIEHAQPLNPPPARSRVPYAALPLGFAAIPAAALVIAPVGWARAFAIVPPLVAVVWSIAARRAAGWAVIPAAGADRSDLLVLRWRGWQRTTLIADRRRLQRAELRTSPRQRALELATFGVRLSSRRRGHVRHLDADTARSLLRTASAR